MKKNDAKPSNPRPSYTVSKRGTIASTPHSSRKHGSGKSAAPSKRLGEVINDLKNTKGSANTSPVLLTDSASKRSRITKAPAAAPVAVAPAPTLFRNHIRSRSESEKIFLASHTVDVKHVPGVQMQTKRRARSR
jgi:hypothetical protein